MRPDTRRGDESLVRRGGRSRVATRDMKKKPPPVPVETAVYKPGSPGGSRQPGLRHPDQLKLNRGQTRGQIKLAPVNLFVGLTHLFRVEHRRGSSDSMSPRRMLAWP